MTLKFNNQTNNGLTVCDGQPNIVSFEEGSWVGTPARLVITIPDNADDSAGIWVEVNGERVVSVASQIDAGVRQFGILASGLSTANNLCNALRSVPSLVTDYDIYFGSNQYSQGLVTLVARKPYGFEISGASSSLDFEFVAISPTLGVDDRTACLRLSVGGKYATTLEKTICSNRTCFDISPVISSYTIYGETADVTVDTWTSDEEGNVTTARTFNITALKGYHIDGQPLYLTGNAVLQNVQGTLYTYDGHIQFSYIGSGEIACTVKTRDSAFNVIDSDSYDFEAVGLTDCNFDVSGLMTGDTFYIDLELPDDVLLRYNVIKPSRMSEGKTRVLFRNSMGGLAFFDFTGLESKKNAIGYETYRDEGSSYGYYNDGLRYDRIKTLTQNDIEYSLKSHIVKKDSLFIFEDMAKSGWVVIDDEMIIVTDITYSEQGYDTYIVELKYKKSRIN